MNNVVRRLVSVVVALAFIVVFYTPPASGAAALSFTYSYCESLGGGRFSCDAEAAGGSGSYAFAWAGVSNASVRSQYGSGSYSTAIGTCTIGTLGRVRVTVTDSTGAALTTTRSVNCTRIAP